VSLVSGYVTTGAPDLIGGSSVQFQLGAQSNDGQYFSLTGAAVTLKVKDPNGTVTTYTASVSNGAALSQVIVPTAIPGTWTRAWYIVLAGNTYVTPAIGFNVVASP
jgi:hypothetical protein